MFELTIFKALAAVRASCRTPLDIRNRELHHVTMSSKVPGPAVLATMMLAAAIVAVLPLTGRLSYELLKDFQPMTAALVALAAGGLAYRGAMAKVAFDRESAERDRNGRKLGIYLRLKSQIDLLANEADHIEVFLSERIEAEPDAIQWDEGAMPLEGNRDEIENAWRNIDLMPREAVSSIDRLRYLILAVEQLNKHAAANKTDRTLSQWTARFYARRLKKISEVSTSLSKTLATAMAQLKRFD
jgi:hypothetical protein